jgi:Polyketide cyclase / dehydrase and lipid transport
MIDPKGLLVAALLAAAAGPQAPATRSAGPPAPPPPTPAEAARLAAGEVLLGTRQAGKRSPAEETGRGVIDAPPARVFAALIDFGHYQEWVPFVKRSDAAPQNDGSVISSQSLGLPFPLGSRYYKILARSSVEGQGEAQVWRAWWSYVPHSGNVADHHGWWVLVPFGDGRTLATCLLFTDPGNLPAWAIHLGTAQTMPYIFSGLRQQIHRSRYDPPAR